MSQVLAHSVFCLCFTGPVSRCPCYTGDSAKWALSLTETSVCQADGIWIQYFLQNYALGLIDNSAGAAFIQEMCLVRWGSQPVLLASLRLSTTFKHRYKCFLIKRNRKAERTVHWSTQQVLTHQHIHVILWPCSDLPLRAMTWAAAQPPWQLQYLLFPLSQMLLRTCSQTMGNTSCRRNISYISSHDTTTTTFP